MTGGGRSGGQGAARAASAAVGTIRLRAGARIVWPDPWGWLVASLAMEVEKRRVFPWIAVAYGIGICLAFSADWPLSAWPPLAAGAALGSAAFAARSHPVALAALVGLTAVFLGFAAVAIRSRAVEAPVLARTTVTKVTGFIETVEERSSGGRIVLLLTGMEGIAEADRPVRIRVTSRVIAGMNPGDHVAATVRILPPPEAARPGGYDFARDAYFRGIGAVGSVLGSMRTSPAPTPRGFALDVSAAVDRARNVMTARIASAVGGQSGAVAAALVTGKRGLIEERTNDVLRAAGIYHVVPA